MLGIFYGTDKSVYTGNFANNLFEGFGTFVWNGGRQIYEGNWKQGKIHGKGKMIIDSGHSYIGEFANGVREGAGVLEYNGGKKFKGTWVKDKLQAEINIFE